MPSPFDALDAMLQGTIDGAFGEGVTIRPQAGDANYGGAPDLSRPVVAGVRMTIARAAKIGAKDYPSSQRGGAPVDVGMPEAWIDAAAYLALGYELRKGDRVEVPDDALTYTIASTHKGDGGDLQIIFAG